MLPGTRVFSVIATNAGVAQAGVPAVAICLPELDFLRVQLVQGPVRRDLARVFVEQLQGLLRNSSRTVG